jgi:hypothetical protein
MRLITRLRNEQNELISELFKMAIVFQRTGSTRKRRKARTTAKKVKGVLAENEKIILGYA